MLGEAAVRKDLQTELTSLAAELDAVTERLRRLEDEEIVRYVRREQPLDCAGSYKIESRGDALFERVETRDHTAIVGLPLVRLCRTLRALGFACDPPAPWGPTSTGR